MYIIIRQESLETQFLIEWMKTKLASLAWFSLFLTVAIGFLAFVGLYTHARIFEDVREREVERPTWTKLWYAAS